MSGSLLLAMMMVLVSWAVLLLMLAGLGLGLQILFGVRTIRTSTLLLSPWNGLAILILFLQAWHFVFAVRWPALVIAVVASGTGLWTARRELRDYARSIRAGWRLAFALALVSLWLANRAIGPGDAFDSGLYHYSVVRWYHEHAIVPGLANLYANFGFNSSAHLFVALLQVGPWDGRANHLANSFLLFVWFITVAISAARLCRASGSRDRAQNLFNLLLAIPLVMYAVSKEASSPTSDFPAAAVAFAAASTFVALLARPREAERRSGHIAGETALLTLSVVLLSTAALCVKLSAGPLVVSIGILAMGAYLARHPPPLWARKTVYWSCGLSLALAVTWIGRSVMLSGYPFYPSKVLAVPAEWRVPRDTPVWFDGNARLGAQRIRVEMLQRATSSPGFQRFPGWITRPIRAATENPETPFAFAVAMVTASAIEVALPVALALTALLVMFLRRIIGKSSSALRSIEWLALAPPIIALLCWAIIAPDPRFATSSFWILAATLVSMTFRDIRNPARLVIAMLVLAALPLGYRMLILKFNPASGPVRSALFIPPGPDHGFHPTPVSPMMPVNLRWGLVIFVPTAGLCWDAPLPSAPTPDRRLRQRLPDDLGSGFVIDSDLPAN